MSPTPPAPPNPTEPPNAVRFWLSNTYVPLLKVPEPTPPIEKEAPPGGTFRKYAKVNITVLVSPIVLTVSGAFVKLVLPTVPEAVPVNTYFKVCALPGCAKPTRSNEQNSRDGRNAASLAFLVALIIDAQIKQHLQTTGDAFIVDLLEAD